MKASWYRNHPPHAALGKVPLQPLQMFAQLALAACAIKPSKPAAIPMETRHSPSTNVSHLGFYS